VTRAVQPPPTGNDCPLLLRPSQVATALGVGLTTVTLMLARGDLPSLKIGTSRRVPAQALYAFVEERLASSAPRR
jgi:excisionase family DNA binding protein